MSQPFPNLPAIESLAPAQHEAVAQVNRLEQVAHETEENADALRWQQAEWVAKCLDGGMSTRQLAALWTNPRTGKPFNHTHVHFVARAWRVYLGKQRPRFNDAYHSPKVRGQSQPAQPIVEQISIEGLKLHERSVRRDTDGLITAMAESLRDYGFTDELVVVASDGATILAGESVVRAAVEAGYSTVPVKRVDVDPDSPEALRVMAKHYAVGNQAAIDMRAHTEMLREIRDELGTLEGTGYNEQTLSLLLLKSRPATEIPDINATMEWIGLAEYVPVPLPVQLVLSFDDEDYRAAVMHTLGIERPHKTTRRTISSWWPPREKADPGSLRFVDTGREKWKDLA